MEGPSDITCVVETRYGIVQFLPGADRMARALAWYGEYLQPQLDMIQRLLPAGAHAIEAGCGVGGHALQLARWIGASGHLFLFETRTIVRRLLQQNLQANQLLTGVTMMRRGLAGPDATGEDRTMEGGAIAPDSIEQRSDTIDDLLLARLDLIKIQAGEPTSAILVGARESLWRLRPRIFAEALDEADLVKPRRIPAGVRLPLLAICVPAVHAKQFQPPRPRHLRGAGFAGAAGHPGRSGCRHRRARVRWAQRAANRQPRSVAHLHRTASRPLRQVPPAQGDKPALLGRLKRLWR